MGGHGKIDHAVAGQLFCGSREARNQSVLAMQLGGCQGWCGVRSGGSGFKFLVLEVGLFFYLFKTTSMWNIMKYHEIWYGSELRLISQCNGWQGVRTVCTVCTPAWWPELGLPALSNFVYLGCLTFWGFPCHIKRCCISNTTYLYILGILILALLWYSNISVQSMFPLGAHLYYLVLSWFLLLRFQKMLMRCRHSCIDTAHVMSTHHPFHFSIFINTSTGDPRNSMKFTAKLWHFGTHLPRPLRPLRTMPNRKRQRNYELFLGLARGDA